MSFLLDTNVVSELRKRAPDPDVAAWARKHARAEVYLSSLVVGEIRRGIERLRERDPKQADVLEAWQDTLVTVYQERILPVSVAVADAWGQLGDLPVVDGLLAATARVHGLTVVTRNVADFARAGVPVVNPFQPPP